MIKAKFMKWQADSLRKAPLRPFELGESGLADLRRNIVISVVTLALLMTISLFLIRGVTMIRFKMSGKLLKSIKHSP